MATKTSSPLIDSLRDFQPAVAPKTNFVVGDIRDAELISETIRWNKVDAIILFTGSVVVRNLLLTSCVL